MPPLKGKVPDKDPVSLLKHRTSDAEVVVPFLFRLGPIDVATGQLIGVIHALFEGCHIALVGLGVVLLIQA